MMVADPLDPVAITPPDTASTFNAQRTRNFLRQFTDALFRYADEDTYIALRVFRDDGQSAAAIVSDSILHYGEQLFPTLERMCALAADQPFAAVFCPPVATFNKAGSAKTEDLANGLTLSVECDTNPEASRKKLSELIGLPTVVVASGGAWGQPDDDWPQDKVHLHWRLSEPTRTPAEHAKLTEARSLACDIVGADATSKTPVHPMRWPGSWHRKNPRSIRMATIIANSDGEIDLDSTLETLREAHAALFPEGTPEAGERRKSSGGLLAQAMGLKSPLEAEHVSDVASALAVIPNADVSWADWNTTLMAIWTATSGSAQGLAEAQEWSNKSNKHNQTETAKRWAHFDTSPPSRIGAGSLFHMARQAQADWSKPSIPERVAEIITEAAVVLAGGIRATPFKWIEPHLIPPRRWLYGKHYIRQFLSATISPGGVGKSSLVICEAIAIATGMPILSEKVWDQSNVWLWNGEDPKDELQRRVAAACVHHSITPAQIAGRLFVDSGRDMEVILATETRDGVVIAQPVVDAVIEQINRNHISVLVIDPFVSSHRVSENDNNAIDRVAKMWSHIADVTGCSIELVHHARKTGGGEVTAEHGRGAVALIAAARSVRVLNRMNDDEAEKSGVLQKYLFFRVDDGKANLAPPSDKSQWFRMASVELGNGGVAGGDKIGVVTPWEWPDPMEGVSADTLKRVQKIIDAGDYRYDTRAAEKWAGHILAAEMAIDAGTKEGAAQAKSILDIWIKNGALVKEYSTDEKSRKRTLVRVGIWAS